MSWEEAIQSAAKRHFGMERNLKARYDEEKGQVDLVQVLTIVPEPTPENPLADPVNMIPVSVALTESVAFVASLALFGLMLAVFGGDYFSYSYLARPVQILGDTFALNRVTAAIAAAIICGGLWAWLNGTRAGMAIRATRPSVTGMRPKLT